MNDSPYYPPSESRGGWRYLRDPDEIRSLAEMDPDTLDLARQEQEFLYSDSSGIVIIRHGYLVREYYSFNVLIPTRFDIWSCTKSLTGTAWGILLDDEQKRRCIASSAGPGNEDSAVNLDSPAYAYLPEGYPLSDPRKERITIRHLLSMTSGIPGEQAGVMGMPTVTWHGPFEHALGRCPNRYGRWADRLNGEPGTVWDYSDPAIAHLALIFARVAGEELSTFLQRRVLDPIGVENFSWDYQGGSGFLGPHTNAHTGAHISARDLARFGYLALHRGHWENQQLVPEAWMALATRSSQSLNPQYGLTWWVNSGGHRWPGLPEDTFAMSGFRSNRCYIIPSLDLVVARVGSGPSTWDEQRLIGRIVEAVE